MASGNLGITEFAEIHELDLAHVATALHKVVAIEGPIHLKEAARRVAESAGFSRVGTRILGHIEKAAVYGHINQMIFLDGDFLFADSSKPVKVRDRSDLPASAKKLELVPQEEIREALIISIGAAFSLSEEDAISEALSMMGFQRSTAKAKQQVGTVLQILVQEERIKFENDKLTAA
jgi:hypothetical protein